MEYAKYRFGRVSTDLVARTLHLVLVRWARSLVLCGSSCVCARYQSRARLSATMSVCPETSITPFTHLHDCDLSRAMQVAARDKVYFRFVCVFVFFFVSFLFWFFVFVFFVFFEFKCCAQ